MRNNRLCSVFLIVLNLIGAASMAQIPLDLPEGCHAKDNKEILERLKGAVNAGLPLSEQDWRDAMCACFRPETESSASELAQWLPRISSEDNCLLVYLGGNSWPVIQEPQLQARLPLCHPYTTYALARWLLDGTYEGPDADADEAERKWHSQYRNALAPADLAAGERQSTNTLLCAAFSAGLPGYFRILDKGRHLVVASPWGKQYRLVGNAWIECDEKADIEMTVLRASQDETGVAGYLRYGLFIGNVGYIEMLLRVSLPEQKVTGVWVALYS